ncbi:MAG TPA: SDR family oxidoreductase [Stellaceae bacterium]|jgi:3-dehydrosphinganine reductase|nr:SDR family oxidoreductase [Stellaceae bacterium]
MRAVFDKIGDTAAKPVSSSPAGHAIVTGGSSGIGLALARLLAREAMDITLIARDEARLAAALALLEDGRKHPFQSFRAISADLSDPDEAEQSVATAIAQLGPPELLVTSAGVARPGYFDELARDVFEEAMRVNYFGTLDAIRAAAPEMRARRRGRIVLISSGAGLVGIYGYTAYAASKFALRGLAEALRAELRPDGVAISIVYPPDTDTPQLAQENLTKPPQTKAITAQGGLWQADAVAREIMRGLRKRRFAITPGRRMALLYWLGGPIAPLLAWYFDRLAGRVR